MDRQRHRRGGHRLGRADLDVLAGREVALAELVAAHHHVPALQLDPDPRAAAHVREARAHDLHLERAGPDEPPPRAARAHVIDRAAVGLGQLEALAVVDQRLDRGALVEPDRAPVGERHRGDRVPLAAGGGEREIGRAHV